MYDKERLKDHFHEDIPPYGQSKVIIKFCSKKLFNFKNEVNMDARMLATV